MSTLVNCGGGVTLERGVPCPMSDGIVLYADHYYPPEQGPQPTLLMRQPYGRDIASTVVYAHPAWFARQGFNVVIQDVRGRGDSEGEFYPFRNEGQDGAETIAAITRRPESNGRVGMYGFSYQGMTQLLAAAQQPEGLVCIAPAMTAHDLYHGWFYHGGALRLASTLGWGLQMLREDARRRDLRHASDLLERAWADLSKQYLVTPYDKHPALSEPELPTYLRDWIEHDQPGDFWSAMDLSQSVHRIAVPALHISGWYDTYLKGSIDGFHALRAHAATAYARDNQYLVAGPWIHIPWGDRIGTHSLGSAATLDTDVLLLRWFNHWLKDSGEFHEQPKISHYVLQQGKWQNALEFQNATYTLYLQSGGRANSSKGDGILSTELPRASDPPDIFIYDPEVPVTAPGGLTNTAGPTSQTVLELGNNVLTYTSSNLESSLQLLGSPQAFLYASGSALETDFVAKLVSVQPSGDAHFICLGIARSSYLLSTNYSADVPTLWQIELDPTSYEFQAGDRIRIEISSSAYPLYDRNPGTSMPARLADPWSWQRSTQTIYHQASLYSSIKLPVIEPAISSDLS